MNSKRTHIWYQSDLFGPLTPYHITIFEWDPSRGWYEWFKVYIVHVSINDQFIVYIKLYNVEIQ